MQRLADLADLGARPGRANLGDALAFDDQRAGIDEGQVIAARAAHFQPPIPGFLAHRHRFAGQQRFVHAEIAARKQHGIRRDAVALGDQHDIVAHHFAPGDALLPAVADDQRARAGEVAQGLQRPFGLLLLVKGDADDHKHKAHQHQGFFPVAQEQVEQAAGDQHEEHGLAHDFQ